jgi:hypothetical protein
VPGGVDHRGVFTPGSPRRVGRHARPRRTCGTRACEDQPLQLKAP